MNKSIGNRKMIIFMGLQGSGKSTFYHERFNDLAHVNLDELHTRNKEKIMLQECIESHESFVVDNTNPQIQDRERYILLAKENGYRVIGYYFASKISDCIERNSKREGKARVPDKAILATHRKLELPSYMEGFDELYHVEIRNDEFIVEGWKDEI